MTQPDVYIAALGVGEIFADPTYQRTLDVARARRYAAEWDRRLAGILEVSDRGRERRPALRHPRRSAPLEVAGKLGISERTVRRIRDDLGLATV